MIKVLKSNFVLFLTSLMFCSCLGRIKTISNTEGILDNEVKYDKYIRTSYHLLFSKRIHLTEKCYKDSLLVYTKKGVYKEMAAHRKEYYYEESFYKLKYLVSKRILKQNGDYIQISYDSIGRKLDYCRDFKIKTKEKF